MRRDWKPELMYSKVSFFLNEEMGGLGRVAQSSGRRAVVAPQDSAFHVVVTSYEMAVKDEKHMKRVRWQYMVLDEAQAVKSSSR